MFSAKLSKAFDFNKAKKRKNLDSGYPTTPNILGPTQTFFKTFGILKSILDCFGLNGLMGKSFIMVNS